MTGLLRDLMEERADDARAPVLDLDAIIATGDKRVRRRRIAAGAGVGLAAAAVVAAVAVAPGVFDQNAENPPAVQQPEDSPFAERRPTYAVGSVIHFGDDEINVAPQSMRSLVQTDDGFAFTTLDGAVFFTDGESTEQIGARGPIVNYGDLRADGSYVAWIDYTVDTPELVVYDTGTGEEVVRTSEGSLSGQPARASYERRTTIGPIDGDTVYWHNSVGFVATQATTGETSTVAPNAYPDFIKYAENGIFSYVTDEGGVVGVGPELNSREAVFQGERGDLSPSGTRVMVVDIEGTGAYDVATEQEVTPDAFGPSDIFVSWLDDDTYTVMRSGDVESATGRLDFLECSIPDESCTVLERNVGQFNEIVWPGGNENGAKS